MRSALGVTFATDGPEDRPLSDRCIMGFNAGPPVNPSFYNNNVQLVQNQDHVVILTEMVHDARIVPWMVGRTLMEPSDCGPVIQEVTGRGTRW